MGDAAIYALFLAAVVVATVTLAVLFGCWLAQRRLRRHECEVLKKHADKDQ